MEAFMRNRIIAIVLILWNITVFAMYGLDKHKARQGKRRVSEKTLLLSAAMMGGAGAVIGMRVFRHKTKHLKFKIGVPLLLAANVAIAGLIMYLHIFQNGQHIYP